MTTPKLDALVIAAHPDDAEIAVGGTLLRLKRAGARIGIVDCTRGEMGTRGDEADRTRETAAANEVLGLTVRENLGLPDGRVEVTVEARERLAGLIRRFRPELVIGHHTEDLHPDHRAAGELARSAWYLSGLKRLAQANGDASAHRPPQMLHFIGHVPAEPALVVDIGEVWETKLELVRCYASQLKAEDSSDDGKHFLFGADILARMETKARYWGETIGVHVGEPLIHHGPLAVDGPLRRLLSPG